MNVDSIPEKNKKSIKIFLLAYHSFIEESVSDGEFAIEEVVNAKFFRNEYDDTEYSNTLFEFAVFIGYLNLMELLVNNGFDLTNLNNGKIINRAIYTGNSKRTLL